MLKHIFTPRNRMILLLVIVIALLSVSVTPQSQSGCCCNTASGNAQSPTIQSQAECDTASGFTFTQITKLPPFDAQTICTETCQSTTPPPDFGTGLLQCGDPLFKPPVKNLQVIPVKGTKTLRLLFDTDCPAQTNFFEISRCKGTESTCKASDFRLVTRVAKDKRIYIDNDPTLIYHQDFTYKVFVSYQFTNGNGPPSFVTGNTGDLECDGVLTSDKFCIGDSSFYKKRFQTYLETNGYPPFTPDAFKTTFDAAVAGAFGLKFNAAFSCNNQNLLVNELQATLGRSQCDPATRCVVRNNVPQCLAGEDCKQPQPGTSFGLGFTRQNCELRVGTNQPRYCYFDRSASVANDCFNCRPDMTCYDYRSQGACSNNNCGVGACDWKFIYQDIGIGVCRDLRTSNCFLCELRGTPGVNEGGFNEIFDVCSEAKNAALGVPGFPCNFQADSGTATDCAAVTCRDYPQDKCGNPVGGIRLDDNNNIVTRSGAPGDQCNLGVCTFVGGVCSKDADGRDNLPQDRRDCTGKPNVKVCELDTVPPITGMIPFTEAPGRTDALIITRQDSFNRTVDPITVQSTDYPTSFCVFPQGSTPCPGVGKPFTAKTTSEALIVKNARLQDGTNILANLQAGTNIIRFFSEDPSHNLEVVKEVSFTACAACQGPGVIFQNVSGSTFDGVISRFFTKDGQPTVTIQFDEAVTITRGLFLASGQPALSSAISDVSIANGKPAKTRFTFIPPSVLSQTLPVTFSVFATSIGTGIAMEREHLMNISVDTTFPTLAVTIAEPGVQSGFTKQTIDSVPVLHVPRPPMTIPFVPSTPISLFLNFSEFIILDNVSVEFNNFTSFTSAPGSINLTPLFQTVPFPPTDANRTYALLDAQVPDGSNRLIIKAHDRATNPFSASIRFVQSSGAPVVRLVKPPQGGSSTTPFELEFATLSPATCRFFIQTVPSIPPPVNPAQFTAFETTGDTTHRKSGVTLPRSEEEFPVTVHCKDAANRESLSQFSLLHDNTPPNFNLSFPKLDPTTIIEQPATSSILVVTDDFTFCRFSLAKAPASPEVNFDLMTNDFPGFNETARKIHVADVTVTDFSTTTQTDYRVNVACKNRANLGPIVTPAPLTFRVVPNIAFEVNSTTLVKFNQTPVFVSAVSNKRSNCNYEEEGSRFLMEGDGQPSTNHRVQIVERDGNHTGTITCQPTGVSTIGTTLDTPITIPVSYVVDLTDPVMQFVNDSSSIDSNPQITVLRDRLLLSWFGTDIGSGINFYNVTIQNLSSFPFPVIRSIVTRRHFNATHVIATLANETLYSARVIAIDFVDRRSAPMDSDGVRTQFQDFPTHCTNNVLDPSTESDTDCGGECQPCDVNKRCNADADCQSLSCTGSGAARSCKPNPACTDNTKNGDETDVDCGGPCKGCGVTQSCIFRSDCANFDNKQPSQPILTCSLGTCQIAAACDNLILGPGNGETDIDCGGSCQPCNDGQRCEQATDCKKDSTCDGKFLVKLNFSSTGTPESFKEIELTLSGQGPPTTSQLEALFGKNTSFLIVAQGGVCINQVVDTDRDGMTDAYEDRHGLDKNNPGDAFTDNDQDGLNNLLEFQYFNTSKLAPPKGFNQVREIDPLRADTDADDFDDLEEIQAQTNPIVATSKPPFHDKDRDNISDTYELRFGLDPTNPFDRDQDTDGDNLTNFQEFNYSLFFGVLFENKGAGVAKELNPRGTLLNNGKFQGFDTDNDGLPDLQEIKLRDDPTQPENKLLFDPLDGNKPPANQDTDLDGMPDNFERRHDLNPFLAADKDQDPDGDGLTNLQEFQYFNLSIQTFGGEREIDPRKADTDDDGFNDPLEIRAITNPADRNDPPPGGEGTNITLVLPPFGIAGAQPFAMQLATTINSTCRFWFSPEIPPVPPPTTFTSLDQFDQTNTLRHTKNALSGISAANLFKQFPLFAACIDAFGRQAEKEFNLSLDTAPPTITAAFADPDPIAQSPLTTELTVVTDHLSFCKFSLTATSFDQMENTFPGFNTQPEKIHRAPFTVPSAATFTVHTACKSPPGNGPTNRDIQVRVDATAPLSIVRSTPTLIGSSQVLISVTTNKDSVCDYLEGTTSARLGDGSLRRTHQVTLFGVPEGSHTASIRCSTPASVSLLGKTESATLAFPYIVDTVQPVMDFVLDDGPIIANPEVSYFKDRLLVKWKGHDDQSGIASYFFKLQDQSGALLVDVTPSTKEDESIFVLAPLIDKQRYIFTVFARDQLGLASPPLSSNGVTVDFGAKPAHCTNGVKDTGVESDRDCGIECPPCDTPFGCAEDTDCTSTFCNIFTNPSRCQVPTCTDTFKNQLETDKDCGGGNSNDFVTNFVTNTITIRPGYTGPTLCNRCAETKTCTQRSDCDFNLTCSFGACTKVTSCENGQLNAGESDIDCGGACATKCAATKQCKVNEDCAQPLLCNPDPGSVLRCIDSGLDTDNDGMPDAYELRHGLRFDDPADAGADPDGDFLTNIQEFQYFKNSPTTFNQTREIDPQKADSDGDTFTDQEEILAGTNPIDKNSQPPARDTDRDGMPDLYEISHGLDFKDPADAQTDFDSDGLSSLQEFKHFQSTGQDVNPKLRDTDNDGFNDKVEIDAKTDPTEPGSHPPLVDSDGDGMSDAYEIEHFLNPNDKNDAALDPDKDNLSNLLEFTYFQLTGREIDPQLRDTDNDGFPDNQEILLGSNPVDPASKPTSLVPPPDADKDGIPDAYELAHGLNPNDATDATKDPDGDGLTNFQEFQYFQFTGGEIDPTRKDSDGDGYSDGQEVTLGFDPLSTTSKPPFPPDLDGDGLDDNYERRHGLNPADPSDGTKDPDGDGLNNIEEYNYFQFTGREIDPQKSDSDGDGASDKLEITLGTNPVDSASKPEVDSDNDGISNTYELKHGLNPNDPADARIDSDGDGLTNLEEFTFFKNTNREIDPQKSDTDGDGFSDQQEILLGFNPVDKLSKPPVTAPLASNDRDADGMADDWEARHNLNPGNASDASADPDGDGLTNLQEFQFFSVTGREIDPFKGDTDSDGFSDRFEIIAGTNPIDPTSKPTLSFVIDTDGDGMPDDYELRHGLSPNDPTDGKRDPDGDKLTTFQEFEFFRDTGREVDPKKADTDGDGFTDQQEILFGSNPVDARSTPPLPDTDGDGMDDLYELEHGLNPNDATDATKDADRDGLTNLEEFQFFKDTGREVDPQKADTDGDGFSDKVEIDAGSNPVDARSIPPGAPALDTDKDGIPDNYEIRNGLNPNDAADALLDLDGDNLTNLREFQFFRDTGREISPKKADSDGDGDNDKKELDCNSNPVDGAAKCTGPPIVVTDTDGDGMDDAYEIRNGLNPQDKNDANLDPDQDGLTNIEEFNFFKNTGKEIKPKIADTDGDGFNDKQEIQGNPPTNPVDPNDKPQPITPRPPPVTDQNDRDRDGMTNEYEEAHNLDPDDRNDARQDPDGDGLNNLEEFRYFRNTGREIDPQRKDTDSDGFTDKEERDQNTNPIDPDDKPLKAGGDSDGDGIPDDYEQRHGLDPRSGNDAALDADFDGMSNLEEFQYFQSTGREIDPQKADTDGDGFNDKQEVKAGTDPTDKFSFPTEEKPEGADSDNDGLPDDYETEHGLDPRDAIDAGQDPDGDGLTNLEEFRYFRTTGQEIDPKKSDTDNDGFSDKAEITAGTNPIDSASKPTETPPVEGAKDTDGDGIPDDYELAHGLDPEDASDATADPDNDRLTSKEEYDFFVRSNKFIDPNNADTDEDGFSDKDEIDAGTDPTDPEVHPSGLDSDTDGIPDDWEIRHNLDPTNSEDAKEDPRLSGLTNLQKYEYYKETGRDLDPFKADFDNDGYKDGVEYSADTNPVDPGSHPTSKLLIFLLILAALALLGGGGYAAWALMQSQKPKTPPPKPTITAPKPVIEAPKPILPTSTPPVAPPQDVFKKLAGIGPAKAPPVVESLTPLEKLAIASLPEFEKEKMAVQLEKLRKGLLSKEERAALFKKLREISTYWSTHKEELEKQKTAWLAVKGTTVSKVGKTSTIPSLGAKPVTPAKSAPAPSKTTITPAKPSVLPTKPALTSGKTPAKDSTLKSIATQAKPTSPSKPAAKPMPSKAKPAKTKKTPAKKPAKKLGKAGKARLS